MRIPVATYRLQFSPDFGFEKAAKTAGYLHELGISDIYASPVFKAKEGSRHGYDVVDLTRLNPDLGSEADFYDLMETIHKLEMGWLQDIVPNHMAFDGENQMLMDVLENGRNSEYFDFFDIDWDHYYESLSERLLAPFLGRHYSESLDAREISLQYDSNGFFISYYNLRLPLKIESYARIITHGLIEFRRKLGDDNPDLIKFLGILYSLKSLPSAEEDRVERYSQIQFIKRMLRELYSENINIREFIDTNIMMFNGTPETSEGISLLDSLLSEQLFRLSFWKVATEEINYRRFFNINGLISLKMEDDRVFNLTHSFIMSLINEQKISGLRIDHIDGLYDPTDYLRKLREKSGSIYIIVEKILGTSEDLSSLWAVQGTTGYDFLNTINGLFCMEENGRKFNKIYYTFTGFKTSYETILYEKKKLVIEKDMAGDVNNLAHLLKGISSKDRYGNDITLYGIKRAIIEVLALFPVYRTFITYDSYSETDRYYIEETIRKAKEFNPALLHELNFMEGFLQLEFKEYHSRNDRKEWVHFIMRLQQLTGPLMAKGFEDTTLYVYNRLISLNDVGGSPDRFGVSSAEFHDFNLHRARSLPHTMNTTSTHDTKRGEDVRARINVLSEIPESWETDLKKWSRLNRRKKKTMKGMPVPTRNDEYFLYQTIAGTLPFYEDQFEHYKTRLKDYIIKAVREAKVHTAWLKPDTEYEENFLVFIDRILYKSGDNQFLNEFMSSQNAVSFYGIFNSLSQTLVKIMSPGLPDIYQGTELWDLSMVDPDNRRSVDFDYRLNLLHDIKKQEQEDKKGLLDNLLSSKEDGRIKLFLIYRALYARNNNRNIFERGNYIPIETSGKYKDSVIAFAWEHQPLWAITVVPRFLTHVVENGQYPLGRDVWGDTHLVLPDHAPEVWTNILTDENIAGDKILYAGDVMARFPCALLKNV
jgi:(1->4)-alpha-D-glucan 1-alpha-D-glucosylmutase